MILRNNITKIYCDLEYFFYSEDLYLGCILRLLGYRTIRASDSHVEHKGTHSAKSSKSRERYQFFGERNRILNIFTFYWTGTIAKIFPILFLNILLKTANNLVNESWKVRAHMKSHIWFLRNLGCLVEKRKKIQSMRRVNDDKIMIHMSSKLVRETGRSTRVINRVVEAFAKLWV